jgi:signal transduction histidine kinase
MNPFPLHGSLRVRLLAGTLFWIIVSIFAAGWGLGKLFHQHVEAQFTAELKNHLDQLTAQLVLNEQNQLQLRLALSDPRLNKPLSGVYWQIDQIAGSNNPGVKALLRSRSLWDETLSVPTDSLADGEIQQHRIDGPKSLGAGLGTHLGAGVILKVVERSVTIDAHPLRLMVAADESLMTEPVANFKGQLWLALGILGVGLTMAALMQVIIGLAPLRSMHAALGRVRNGDTQKMEGTFPSEIMPLVNEFNSVLAQNAEVVERARTQAGNLAHALKTPLSVLANAASSPQKKDDELARLVLAQVDAVRKQADYHLTRAQAAASVRLPGVRTPVKAVVQGLVRVMQRVYADRNLEFIVLPVGEALAFRGEEQDLQEMLGNLIDNAAKWATSRIEIQVEATADKFSVSINDDGSGIDEKERDHLVKRGVRADEKIPGTGLGLAIVEDLASMYGGELSLRESHLGGLKASLILPVA